MPITLQKAQNLNVVFMRKLYFIRAITHARSLIA